MPAADGPRGFEVLEHTADLGLRVWAPDLAGMFGEAARALIAVMGRAEGETTRCESISLESPDLEALLVDWLSEVLFLFEARNIVPKGFDVQITDDHNLTATVTGPGAEGFVEDGTAVKAVTYHRVSVAETDHGWEARVYLDI